MINREKLKEDIKNGIYNKIIEDLYCIDSDNINFYIKRYLDLIENFEKTFGFTEQIGLFSAPGRTEIGGNHTDHQHGCVIAGSVNLDVIAVASVNNLNVIRVQSEGYPADIIDLEDLSPNKQEYNSSKSLIKGSHGP